MPGQIGDPKAKDQKTKRRHHAEKSLEVQKNVSKAAMPIAALCRPF